MIFVTVANEPYVVSDIYDDILFNEDASFLHES